MSDISAVSIGLCLLFGLRYIGDAIRSLRPERIIVTHTNAQTTQTEAQP